MPLSLTSHRKVVLKEWTRLFLFLVFLLAVSIVCSVGIKGLQSIQEHSGDAQTSTPVVHETLR